MTRKDMRIFKNIPTLRTDRLTLRRIMPSDLDDVYEYASDREVSRYLLWSPHRDSLYTRDYLLNLQILYSKGRFYDWGIIYNGKMIGTVGFSSIDLNNNSAEVGYVLNRKYWHFGIASEAVKRILDFGFNTLELDSISAKYMVSNTSSKDLALRVGMTEDSEYSEFIHCKGNLVEVHLSRIIKESFLND